MDMMHRKYRGSRKHVLDWVQRPNFRSELENLIGIDVCQIPTNPTCAPKGAHDAGEVRLDVASGHSFCNTHTSNELRRWWLSHPEKGNTPNWDLIVECELGRQPGLVLVEAKANAAEFSRAGKRPPSRTLSDGTRRAASSFSKSEGNHQRIGDAIEEARDALASQLPEIRIHRDRVYQLSNRVAFAWKLATLGVPSVVVYLGFIGDSEMDTYFATAADWDDLLGKRVSAVIPSGLPSGPITAGTGRFWIVSRHWNRIAVSPPRLRMEQA